MSSTWVANDTAVAIGAAGKSDVTFLPSGCVLKLVRPNFSQNG